MPAAGKAYCHLEGLRHVPFEAACGRLAQPSQRRKGLAKGIKGGIGVGARRGADGLWCGFGGTYPVTFMKRSVAPHTIAKASTITR